MLKELKKFAARGSIIAILLVVLVLAVGCTSSTEVMLDANDNDHQIELKKGQVLVIALEGNPTTGYTWEAVELEEQVLRQKGETEFKPKSDAVGASGVQTLRFEAVNAGQTDLKLIYHRPWEKDVEPLETFSVQVVVR
jgi:inhibitor of cysteine peptidase